MDGRQLAIEIAKDKRKTPDEMRPRGGRGGRNDNNRGHRGGDYNRDNRGGYGRGSNRDYPSRDYDRYDNRGGSYPPRDYGRRSRSRSRDYDRHNDYRARPDFRGRDDRYYPEVQIVLPQLLLFYITHFFVATRKKPSTWPSLRSPRSLPSSRPQSIRQPQLNKKTKSHLLQAIPQLSTQKSEHNDALSSLPKLINLVLCVVYEVYEVSRVYFVTSL